MQNLRNVSTAEVVLLHDLWHRVFRVRWPNLGGTGVIVDQNANARLIDEVLASGLKSGYNYSYTVLTSDAQGHVTSYSMNADPQVVGNTGQRRFLFRDKTSA